MKQRPIMNTLLRILHLEDDPIDARLVGNILLSGGVKAQVTLVTNRGDYEAAIEHDEFDLVLADYQLPIFDGMEALALWRERYPDVPFLFVTGTLGEECVVEALKNGATDFLLKDRLSRLVPAVRRAMAEAEASDLRRQAEQALRDSEERLRHANMELARRVTELGAANAEVRASRRAALNLMEDALSARSELEEINMRLRAEIAERKQVEQALRESEADYRSLFEAAGVGNAEIAIETGRFLRVNKKFCQLTGYTAEELLDGMVFSQLIHPDDRDTDMIGIIRFIRGAVPAYEFEKRYICKINTVIWVHVACSLFRDSIGRPLRLIAVVQDITARKQAEEALREQHAILQTILDNATDVIFMKDRDGRYMVMNAAGAKITGKNVADILGRDAYALFPPEVAAEKMAEDHRLIINKTSGNFEESHNFDGRVQHFSTAKTVCCDLYGNVIGLVGIARDVTERREMEAALIDADRRKDEFLAMLAHELRNPLAPIRNAVQLLNLEGHDETRVAWVCDILERNVAHMVRLVDDLLDVSRITRGKVTLQNECVVLATILERAVETSRPLLDIKHHTLQVRLPEQPVYLCGDRVRLAQIFSNLLNNSAKYTTEGGHIELTAEVDGLFVLISVTDNGTGIRKELLPHVFDLFRQDECGLDRSQGGLGIGLTLVKRLVELHAGEVTARSAGLDQGAQFTVRLPILNVIPEQTERADDVADSDTKNGLRVLVIDDNPDMAESIAVLLQMFGHRIEIAVDGAQGLDVAQRFEPDVVLLDIGLPGMDGYELARRLREAFASREVLLIALSGYGRSEDIVRATEAGIDHYLVKPADPIRLRDLISDFQVTGETETPR